MSFSRMSRRTFIFGSAATMGACATGRKPSLKRSGYISPNEKLFVAGIGVGGKGSSDVDGCASETIVALCDVDWDRAGPTFERYPKAKKYRDFRDMLEKEKHIDAVTVSTADHVHAVAAMTAIKMGKHVYVQKPLTHTIYEARKLTEAAREYGVATQMGNQGHSSVNSRRFCEMVWSGVLGEIREVHAWTNRPIWPQGISDPLPEEPVPEHIDWDLWLGPAPWRPYNSGYAPFKWRGWWDFGTGALGDMGCHVLDGPNWALQLDCPTSVECVSQEGKNDQTGPTKSVIRYEFPARGSMPPVTLYWHDGGNKPEVPDHLKGRADLEDLSSGNMFIGDRGVSIGGYYGTDVRLYPESLMSEYESVQPMLPRSAGHYREWIQACKDGPPSPGDFNYAGPFTEWVLLGNLALRAEGKLFWDGPNMKVTNNKDANQYVKMEYRKGWSL